MKGGYVKRDARDLETDRTREGDVEERDSRGGKETDEEPGGGSALTVVDERYGRADLPTGEKTQRPRDIRVEGDTSTGG